MKITKQFISKAIQITILVIIGAAVVAVLFFGLQSCSVQQDLHSPNRNDLIVVAIDSNDSCILVCKLKYLEVKYWPKADTLKPGVLVYE